MACASPEHGPSTPRFIKVKRPILVPKGLVLAPLWLGYPFLVLISPSFALAVSHTLFSALEILVNMQLRILSPTRIRLQSAMSRQGAYRPPKALGAKSLSRYKYTFIPGLAASVPYISHTCFLPSFSFANGGDLPPRF
jgi:hypothetical protein